MAVRLEGKGASVDRAVSTLKYILEKWDIDQEQRSPIAIPNVGRDDLAQLFCELGFKTGLEVGVEQGVFAETLCKANPDSTIYGLDAWKAYKGYRDHVTQEKLDRFYESTMKRMAPYNWYPVRRFSMDALDDFEDGSLDWVYIDANHELPYILNDIIGWARKVRRGGIVSGHDYRKSKRFDTRNHVVFAVDAYTLSYRIKPWFLLGRKEKLSGETRDDARSWFWVKRHA